MCTVRAGRDAKNVARGVARALRQVADRVGVPHLYQASITLWDIASSQQHRGIVSFLLPHEVLNWAVETGQIGVEDACKFGPDAAPLEEAISEL
jgi:hypothetical protein